MRDMGRDVRIRKAMTRCGAESLLVVDLDALKCFSFIWDARRLLSYPSFKSTESEDDGEVTCKPGLGTTRLLA